MSPSPDLAAQPLEPLLSDAASTSSVSSADTALTAPDLAVLSSSSVSTIVPQQQTQQQDLQQQQQPSQPQHTHDQQPMPDEQQPALPAVSAAPELLYAANDDSVIQYEPSRHVDYLSHNWQEADISSSWRYIVLRRKDVANSARLENASWRTWTKAKYNLKTVSPESVNWLKDYDVTWLYGPLATQTTRPFLDSSPSNESATERIRNTGALSPPLRSSARSDTIESRSNSKLSKKPILKKRSMSEVMLSRSVSSSNLIKQAAASVAAERHLRAPGTTPTTASYSSHQSPYMSLSPDDRRDPRFPSSLVARGYAASTANFSDRLTMLDSAAQKPSSTKHIHFSDRVEQCIALEAKDDDEDSGSHSVSVSATSSVTSTDDEDEDEEEPGLFLMVRSGSGSFQRPASLEPHTIAKLPATRLKYVPEIDDMPGLKNSSGSNHSSTVSFSMGDDDGDDEYDDDDYDDGASIEYRSDDEEHRRYRHGLSSDDEEDYEYRSRAARPSDGYFSANPSSSSGDYSYRHRHDEEPESNFLEDVPTPTLSSMSRNNSSSNLRKTSSGISIASRSSTSNLQAVAAAAQGATHVIGSSYARSRYLEDASAERSSGGGLESTSESDDEEIVDMDSNLLSSLRRDSVVLARGRIGEPLSPSTQIDPAYSVSSAINNTPVSAPAPAADAAAKEVKAVESISSESNDKANISSSKRPASVNSEASVPTPPVVDSSSEHSDDEEIEQPQGFWGHVTHAFSAAKELGGVFMNGGRWKSSTSEERQERRASAAAAAESG
ncbi:hypothetical protein BZA70DRAFT_291164 [Myxozyma melibiosi]|uniref:Nitrogen regulatory protein areA GATA-like domain-containing protein n=1 Tax=Myxozyma melibiosi TaxID=54550 RepID=A0ABR1F151_9ASCO